MSHWQETRIHSIKQERASRGICIACGSRPRTEKTKRCDPCRLKLAAYQRRYMSLRKSEGVLSKGYAASFRQIALTLGEHVKNIEYGYRFAMTKLEIALYDFDIDTGGISVEQFIKLALARGSGWRMAHWSEFLATAIETATKQEREAA